MRYALLFTQQIERRKTRREKKREMFEIFIYNLKYKK